jgi:hypothetical protein
MYTKKTANGKQLRPEAPRPLSKVVNKPAFVEVTADEKEDDAEANMCPGSRDV